jgi:hypothetical protein
MEDQVAVDKTFLSLAPRDKVSRLRLVTAEWAGAQRIVRDLGRNGKNDEHAS